MRYLNMQKNVSLFVVFPSVSIAKQYRLNRGWSVFCEAEMNPFCLDCTATCVVFLYLAKSNAFVSSVCWSLTPCFFLTTVQFFLLLLLLFIFFLVGFKQKESNTVFVCLEFSLCVSVGVGGRLESMRHKA